MKKIKIITTLLMIIFSIIITGCQEQSSKAETTDPFVGVWQAQTDDIYNSIEEIVITKEKIITSYKPMTGDTIQIMV